MKWLGISKISSPAVCVCASVCVAVCAGSSMLKNKDKLAQNRTTIESVGAYKYVETPCNTVFLVYYMPARGA